MPSPRASGRTPPRKRFVGAEHLFDLDAEADRLGREPEGSRSGHRQITLFSGGGVSIVLFDFEAEASLENHAAAGYVTVHVLSGKIEMATAEQEYRMQAGSLLVLRPNVAHDVRARIASRMLLSVRLDPSARPGDGRHG
jgi:quercetin dioxygenase-like cupin family protein